MAIKLYSPTQVYASSFLGGPLAMIFVLRRNFEALGNKAGAKWTLIGGLVFTVALFTVLLVLWHFNVSTEGGKYLVPLLYSVVARQICEKYQKSKQAIQDAPEYEFQSNWKVFGLSLGFAILLILIVGGLALGTLELVRYQNTHRQIDFVPEKDNGKEIVVRGLSSREVIQILAPLDKTYKDQTGVELNTQIGPDIEGVIHMRFPDDIAGPAFLGLIERLQFPDNVDRKPSSITVAGETILSSDFLVPSHELIGQNAIFYFPPDDPKPEIMNVQVGDRTFQLSLDEQTWSSTTKQDVPVSIQNLLP
jgi:hypothetical protein